MVNYQQGVVDNKNCSGRFENYVILSQTQHQGLHNVSRSSWDLQLKAAKTAEIAQGLRNQKSS